MSSEAIKEFVGTNCGACGHAKKPYMAFCTTCYFALPLGMRHDLYKRIGEGFERAWYRGREWLQLNNARAQDYKNKLGTVKQLGLDWDGHQNYVKGKKRSTRL